MNDPVNHPAHYTTGKIEVIDFITDKKLDFCRGNAVKYIVRAGLKDPAKEIEDLKKARWYLDHYIQIKENELNTGDPDGDEYAKKIKDALVKYQNETISNSKNVGGYVDKDYFAKIMDTDDCCIVNQMKPLQEMSDEASQRSKRR